MEHTDLQERIFSLMHLLVKEKVAALIFAVDLAKKGIPVICCNFAEGEKVEEALEEIRDYLRDSYAADGVQHVKEPRVN